MLKTILLVFFCLSILGDFQTYAQCCAAGNPAGGDAIQSNLMKNQWNVSTFYRYSQSDDYYHLQKPFPFPYIATSYYNFFSFSVAYGISNKLSAQTEAGYFAEKTQENFFSGITNKISSHGFGDIFIGLRYSLLKTSSTKSRLLLTSGLRLPIGAFNETQDGIVIPISLQPSSGAMKIINSFFYSKKIIKDKASVLLMCTYEWSNPIDKEFLYYKYGGFLQIASGFHFPIQKFIMLNTIIKYEYRAHDTRENDLEIESTGGKVFYFNPIVTKKFKKDFSLIIQCEIPLYKNVNGYQLTNKFGLQTGIRKVI